VHRLPTRNPHPFIIITLWAILIPRPAVLYTLWMRLLAGLL
jgi:hypothetical protein